MARILELRRGQLRQYTGIYTNYAAARKQEEESAWAQYERAGKEVHRLRGPAGERNRMARKVQGNKATAGASADFYARKASKVMKRAKAIGRKVEQQLEQQKTAKPFVEKQTILDFPPMEESGAVVINAIGISKGFDDHPLFSDTTFSVNRGQRVAIIGCNGSGKTTLIKILLGLFSRRQWRDPSGPPSAHRLLWAGTGRVESISDHSGRSDVPRVGKRNLGTYGPRRLAVTEK